MSIIFVTLFKVKHFFKDSKELAGAGTETWKCGEISLYYVSCAVIHNPPAHIFHIPSFPLNPAFSAYSISILHRKIHAIYLVIHHYIKVIHILGITCG